MTPAYNIRASVLFIFFCFAYTLIIFNLYLIQIRQANFFTHLGTRQYHISLTKNPPRATIVDRHGAPLALNKDSVAAFILPNKVRSPETLLPFLQEHFPHAHNRFKRSTKRSFMFIKRKLSPEQIDTIHQSNVPDVQLLKEPNRFYPVACAAPIIGMTNIDNRGLFGLELQCNTILSGKPTTYSLDKDARSGYFYFKKETTKPGTTGTTVQTTIDSTLQFLAHQELQNTVTALHAKQGAVIIMDPTTGAIIAMATHPHINPNSTGSIDSALTKNIIITDTYEFGSVIKTFAALAALDEQVVTPDELIDCQNTKTGTVCNRTVNTVKAHGIITFADVVAVSNNIGMATVAQRIGPALYDHYRRIGFGTKTGIPFAGEQAGFVNPSENWSKQSIMSLSYGYEVSTTLLQLACAFCMIANNGYPITPHLVLTPETTQHTTQPLYAPEIINTLKQILHRTTERGTTRRTRIKGYTIMSKTGTANLLVNGAYRTDKNIFTCAGIIEKDAYKRVMVTFINQAKRTGVHADTIAVPLFERIAERLLIHERVV